MQDEPTTLPDSTELEVVGWSPEVVQRLAAETPKHLRYRVKGEMARGGMGSILRVWDGDLLRHLAMKVVLGPDDESKELASARSRRVARFLEEAQVTAQLDHPGIVPVHELGLDERGRLYFTMKLVRGHTLGEILQRTADGDPEWSRARVLGVMQKICDAMSYAHEKGVVHRDLKPANVMVGRFGEVYVMDWGLARVLSRPEEKDVRVAPPDPGLSRVLSDRRDGASSDSPLLTLDGDVIGTPAYMSPEQARGDLAAMDGRTDVFAVGAMLYHLLAGHMPYVPTGARTTNEAVWSRVQEGPPRPLAELARDTPAELVAICEKAMERDLAKRYASMQELSRDLRAFLEGRVVRAHATGAVAELRKWVRRNRPLALTALAALVVAFAAVGGAALRLSDKNAELAEATEQARANEALAQEKARAAEEAQARFLSVAGLADRALLSDLVAEARELYPPVPARVPALEAWLAKARGFAEKLPHHERNLAELGAVALPGEDGADGPSFARPEDRWQHDHLVALLGEIRAFLAPRGPMEDVERRLALARGIAERTTTGAEAQWAWSEALDSVASPGECPRYGGLELAPQLGLLPLGRDPRSGLWEFAHLLTGEAPARDPSTGELLLTEASGVVLVLVPGGTARVGAQALDPAAPHYDPAASEDEAPILTAQLEPFFLSKYEMTQAQWLRSAGSNPSIYTPDDPLCESLLNPVENLGWRECSEVLARVALTLPTEAQWEYAARAGTGTPWWTGADVRSLVGAANLADATFRTVEQSAEWVVEDWLEDHFVVHAPVGRFRPNPFGLYDVHGNVWEWCRDEYAAATVPLRPGDGLRQPETSVSYVNRGGGWANPASFARLSRRYNTGADARSNDLGVRPARALER